MKKCPYCAEEIQDEAIVCKHCGRDLSQPTPIQQPNNDQTTKSPQPKRKKRPILLIFLLLLLVIFIIIISSGNDEETVTVIDPVAATVAALNGQNTAPTIAISDSQQEPTEVAEQIYHIGDIVKIGDVQLIISQAYDVQPSDFYKPEEGNRYIGIDVTFENVGSDSEYVSTSDFKLIGPDGFQYATSYKAESAGDLTAVVENLITGTKIAGSAGFEIPASQSGFRLTYKPSFSWDDIIVEFEIGY